MKNTIQIPASTLDHVIKYVEVTSALNKRALDEVGVSRQSRQKAAGLVDPLLQHMIDSGVVAPNQKEAAQALLGAHDSTLGLLKSAVDRIVSLNKELAKKVATDLGKGEAGEKEAGDAFDSLNNPHVGARTSYMRESDKPLMALIGK